MRTEDREVWIRETRGHWEVYVNGEFFCTADSYTEALNELYEVFKYIGVPVEEIGYNQPAGVRYPTENPWR